MSVIRHLQPMQQSRPPRILTLILGVLFFGPLLAPLLQATQLPFAGDTGAFARDMLATYVCPTPAKSYMLLGFPMAVCARCWGATIGLWAGWLLWNGPVPIVREWYFQTHWLLRISATALPFLFWVVEIIAWPTAPYTILLLNGALAGIFAGLLVCSIWPMPSSER